MGKAKQWCTLTRVSSLVYRENKTVTVLLGYLRARWILSSENYALFLIDRFGFGNPASHLSVKQYLKSVQTEQAQARVSPKQATPLFFDKFKKTCIPLQESPVM